MIVYQGKLKGKEYQYRRLDEAIRTGLFIRNACLRYWEDGHAKTRNDFSKYCTILGKSKEFPWAGKLNSQARQAMSERAWAAISRFFDNCKKQVKGKKGYPKYKKISDAAWSEFRRWLEYFGKVFGVATVAVKPHYTSQNCSNCGCVVKKTLSTRTHQCKCGFVLDRDWNAAINILKAALRTVGHTGTFQIDWINASGQLALWCIDESQYSKASG